MPFARQTLAKSTVAVRIAALTLLVSAITAGARAQTRPNGNSGPALTVTFQATTVTASGVTPGGRVAFFAIGRQPQGYWSSIYRWKTIVSDEDRDGTVMFDLKTAVPPKSIWAVVDLSTRQFVVTTPNGEAVRTVGPEKTHLNRGHSGAVAQFGLTTGYVDMLYVSPEGDAWTWSDTDGSVTKFNRQGYDTTVDTAQARPFSSDKGQLHELREGGVIVFFDWWTMRVFAARLDAAAIGGAK